MSTPDTEPEVYLRLVDKPLDCDPTRAGKFVVAQAPDGSLHGDVSMGCMPLTCYQLLEGLLHRLHKVSHEDFISLRGKLQHVLALGSFDDQGINGGIVYGSDHTFPGRSEMYTPPETMRRYLEETLCGFTQQFGSNGHKVA